MSQRAARYESILPTTTLRREEVVVVGVGAVGRQVALQLATMGVGHIHLVDFDVVDEANLGTQGYAPSTIGQHKVLATAAQCEFLNPDIKINPHAEAYASKHMRVATAVFTCPDDITVRRAIYNDIASSQMLLVDTRMSSEVIDVLASVPPHAGYCQTLFEAGESIGHRCALNTTIYTATLAASLAVAVYSKWLRDIPPDEHTTYNILANELTVRSFQPLS